ncbi:hypothetical protein SAMD00019534_041530 [Acytostelium subglobosum LB1]|uniref:hypothetical protein n=1 Tax=Acytostelium subglobosum LB1 TaxID=1410327 RepID=UPI000644DE02|nr:hypothetical protein SAMD00019534_041530 [Acytostelium subglobosum LB1]GAM20978.1 hypothetical protein SAMD00019534_041530 [Acytostelium subglobosum LB1]|eukprot:XP_012756112.1 hypothetical protein SAMD00019534_041530 [Acytostelium subglobosum LB1]
MHWIGQACIRRPRRFTILLGTSLLLGVSILLVVSLLMRIPSSYTQTEDNYEDRVLNSYCRFSMLKSRSQLQAMAPPVGCVFQAGETNGYDCTPASPHRAQSYHYELELEPGAIAPTADPFTCSSPVVTVIIPVYNTDTELLQETVVSLERQSLQAFEVIVVDDGSSDLALKKFIQRWKERDGRVSVRAHSTNRGLSAARNTGVKYSKASYIFFLDGDDMIEPTTLEKLAWKLETSPHISFAKGYTIGFGQMQYTWDKGFEQGDAFITENQVTATIMYRKDVFSLQSRSLSINQMSGSSMTPTFFGFDERITGGMEDWDFLLKCAERGLWGETVPEYLDWYRRKDHNGSVNAWSNFNKEKRDELKNEFKLKYPIIHANSIPKIEKTEKEYHMDSNLNFNNQIKKVKPRILIIVPWFNTGGADKFNLNLVSQLIEKGWEVTIVSTVASENPWLDQFKQHTTDIFVLNNFLSMYDFPRFLCYLVESRRIDITLVTNSEVGYLFMPYLNERCPYSTVVDYVHMEEEDWKNGGFARYSLSMQSQLDLSIVTSDHLKEWMIKKAAQRFHNHHHQSGNSMAENRQKERQHEQYSKILSEHIDVSYVNVDTFDFTMDEADRATIRSRYSIAPKDVVLLFAARLTPQKQPMVALEVFKDLMLKNVTFSALVSGDGPMRSDVEEYLHRNGMVEVVKMLGNVPVSDMPSLISASDIVFLPSKMEGISMLFYEAMSSGVVPVGANVGGQSELVTPEEGILIDRSKLHHARQEIDQYSQALEGLITNPSKLKRMAANCRSRIDKLFNMDVMGNRMISLFCKASYNKQSKERVNEDPVQRLLGHHGVGLEMALQSIESMKWQKKSDDMWRQLENYRKQFEGDQYAHQQCEMDRESLTKAKQEVTKCQQEVINLKEEYNQYVKDNENLFGRYNNSNSLVTQG